MQKPPRPTGIAVLAILELVGGVLAVLGGAGIAAVGGSGMLASFGYAGLSGMVAVVGGVVLVVGLVALLLGWGMWTGKSWAWSLSVAFYIIGAILDVASIVIGGLTGIVGLLIDIFLLWYLWRPHVKAYFGKGAPTQPAMAPQPAAQTM
jgi:hypothetical protein